MPKTNKKTQAAPVEEPVKEKAPMSIEEMKYKARKMVANFDKNILDNERNMEKDIASAVDKRRKGLDSSWETKNVALAKMNIEMARKQKNSVTTMVERREMFEVETDILAKMNSFMQNIAMASSHSLNVDKEKVKDFSKTMNFFESQSRHMNDIVNDMSIAMTGDAEDYLSGANSDIEEAINAAFNIEKMDPHATNEEVAKKIYETLIT